MFSLFVYGVFEVVIVGLRVADATGERETIRLELAKALDLLTREAASAYNVDNSTSSRFQFDARIGDNDGNGSANNLNNINWRVQNGDLQRVQGGVTTTVVPDLTSCTFTYLDANGNATNTANNVRVMEVVATAVMDGETLTMAAATRTRNQ